MDSGPTAADYAHNKADNLKREMSAMRDEFQAEIKNLRIGVIQALTAPLYRRDRLPRHWLLTLTRAALRSDPNISLNHLTSEEMKILEETTPNPRRS